jgi:hypothetical protein
MKNQRKKTPSDQESPEVPSVALPSSPQEEKFWTTPLGPSRTLHFTDNLMDELVDLGDISTASFQSPLPMQPTSKLGPLGTLALFDAPFMSNLTPEKDKDRENDDDRQEDGCKDLNSTLGVDDPPVTPTVAPHLDTKDMNKKPDNQIAETPSRQRRIRVNIEVERIIVSMECILSDIGLQSFA